MSKNGSPYPYHNAIEVLPDEFAKDADQISRFQCVQG